MTEETENIHTTDGQAVYTVGTEEVDGTTWVSIYEVGEDEDGRVEVPVASYPERQEAQVRETVERLNARAARG